MDINFDVQKVFRERLATSMGLDSYTKIIEQVKTTNIATDKNFQKLFNGFYLVRRNETWRKNYYNFFETIKNTSPTFESIITHLYEVSGNIEASFSSKMLASIFPEKPIWDRYIIQNLNLELTGNTQLEKLQNAITIYANIEKWIVRSISMTKLN